MIDIKLTSVKDKIKLDEDKNQAAYELLKEVQKKEAQRKVAYQEKGLEKPELLA